MKGIFMRFHGHVVATMWLMLHSLGFARGTSVIDVTRALAEMHNGPIEPMLWFGPMTSMGASWSITFMSIASVGESS